MRRNSWKPYVYWILFTEMVGGLSGWLTREGTKLYPTMEMPPFSPPGILFPVVWTILFALMGIGAARIYLTPSSAARSKSLMLYLIQLTFDFFWSIIFFNFRSYGFALLWLLVLWILILRMILTFAKVDKTAAVLQIPYLLWSAFAVYLNLGVWILNR